MSFSIKDRETIALDFAKDCKTHNYSEVNQTVHRLYKGEHTNSSSFGSLTKKCYNAIGGGNTLRIASRMCSNKQSGGVGVGDLVNPKNIGIGIGLAKNAVSLAEKMSANPNDKKKIAIDAIANAAINALNKNIPNEPAQKIPKPK